MIVWDARVAEWVGEHIPGCNGDFGNCRALGVIKNDRLVGGVVYHNYNPQAEIIELSCAAIDRRWLTRETVRVIFNYPFDFCQMIVARTAPDNTPVRNIYRRLGADEYEIPRLRGREESEIIITLTQEAWRNTKFRGSHG